MESSISAPQTFPEPSCENQLQNTIFDVKWVKFPFSWKISPLITTFAVSNPRNYFFNDIIIKNYTVRKEHKKPMEEDLSITHAHDKFFKESFSRKDTVCSFITEYLPKSLTSKLNLETLAIQKDSFINKKFAETFSDLLYSVELSGKKSYIYFLFEHKSYIDKWVMYQLLRGMVSVWDCHIKKYDFKRLLPVVVPIVIYHGEKEWDVENSLGHLFDCDDNIKHYIPEFRSETYDISYIPEEEIRGSLFLRAYMHFFNRTKKRTLNELLNMAFALLSEIYNEKTKLDCFELFLRYFGSIAKPEEWENVNVTKYLSKQEGEKIMRTAADMFIEQGIEIGKSEGIEEGLERGIEQGKIEDAKMMLQMELTIEQIIKITGLSREKIENLQKILKPLAN